MPLNVGDKFPEDVTFGWVPITDSDPTQCGVPQEFPAGKKWQGKKVVLVSVPGAFTPGCQANHLPPYISKLKDLKAKGVDQVAVIGYNDGWVMNAWGKVNKVTGDDILFLSDDKGFSKNHAYMAGNTDRNGRYALVIEKDGTISYFENESNPSKVTVSGLDAVLSKL